MDLKLVNGQKLQEKIPFNIIISLIISTTMENYQILQILIIVIYRPIFLKFQKNMNNQILHLIKIQQLKTYHQKYFYHQDQYLLIEQNQGHIHHLVENWKNIFDINKQVVSIIKNQQYK
ncbi:unnamed protein product [Paramecium sonneborni]|uniref:Transmembrane protein n=1 Tax=Paramecium sonneborni TaxID=65129 RepID=A0A8S1R8N8_9CILI|nr:unnamed protein product [Paramecium sonneborni]